MQSGCRLNRVWRVLAIAGAIGAASAALAAGPTTGNRVRAAPLNVEPVQGQLQRKVEQVPGATIEETDPFQGPPVSPERGTPPNDFCISATPISIGDVVSGTTVGASPDDGTAAACNPGGQGLQSPGVWYSFVGNGNSVRISLCGSAFSTFLRVIEGFCGGPCAGFNAHFCNGRSQLDVTAQNGTTYYIFVHGVTETAGLYTLALTDVGPPPPPPANDFCTTATPISLGDVVTGSTVLASPDDGTAAACPGTSGLSSPGVWYSFVGNGNFARISLCGSDYSTHLRVVSGFCGGPCAGFNSSFCGSQSQLDILTVNGESYFIYVSGFGFNSGSYMLALTDLGGPPANDFCTTATPISLGDVVTGSTVRASPDDGTAAACNPSGTGLASPGVWYSFVANGNPARISLCGSGYNTYLRVIAQSCDSGICAGYDNDFCQFQESQLDIGTINGESYFIYVHGVGSNAGPFTLALTDLGPPPPGPDNDFCAGALPISIGGSVSGDTTGANPDLVASACNPNGPGLTSPGVWYTFTGDGNPLRISTCGLAFWDTYVRVFSGACDALVCEGWNDDACGLLQSQFNLSSINGVQYFVYLSAGNSGLRPSGPYTMTLSLGGPPANDVCGGAMSISCGASTIADNSTATTSAEDFWSCRIGGGVGAGSIWYSFVATETSARLQTCGSFFPASDSILEAFAGVCGGLVSIGCNDAACNVSLSRLDLTGLNIGETYYVQLSARTSAHRGPYNLQLICTIPPAPPNDTCATATPLSLPALVTGDTSLNTPDTGLPACGVGDDSPSAWYSIVGTGNDIQATTCSANSTYNTVLTIFTDSCVAPTCVAPNEDWECPLNPWTFLSRVVFPTVAGQTYYIVVRGYSTATTAGPYELFVEEIPPFCGVIPPPGAQFEDEPNCGMPDATNDGCYSTPNVYDTVQCGAAFFGTAAFDGVFPDSDWLQLTLTETTEVTLTLRSEFIATFGVVGNAAGPIAFNPNFCNQITDINPSAGTAANCQPISIQVTLDAGTWVVIVAPVNAIVNCGDNDSYVLEIGCGTSGCSADWNNDGVVNSNDISAFLTTWLADVTNGTAVADFDGSGVTNSNDISAFLTAWIAQVGGPC